MKCEMCGTELGRVTSMHLNGPKCKNDPELGRRLSIQEYNERFGRAAPAPIRRKKFKVLATLLSVTEEECHTELGELEAKIQELESQRALLLGLLQQRFGSVKKKLDTSTTSNGDLNEAARKYATRIMAYLKVEGSATPNQIDRSVDKFDCTYPIDEIMQELLRTKQVQIRGNKFCLPGLRTNVK